MGKYPYICLEKTLAISFSMLLARGIHPRCATYQGHANKLMLLKARGSKKLSCTILLGLQDEHLSVPAGLRAEQTLISTGIPAFHFKAADKLSM